MNLKLLSMTLMTAALGLSPLMAQAQNKVIYGEDNRVDPVNATAIEQELALSTAAMIDTNAIKMTQDGSEAVITGDTLAEGGICSTARFASQITAPICSGFLVGDDLLVTAGHCMDSASYCKDYSWVFDFADDGTNLKEIKVAKTSVYGCKEIISQVLDRTTLNDFALIRLSRKVTDRPILSVRESGKIADDAKLTVIGHPSGLPIKIASGALIRNNSNDFFFVANLDTFGGNSGSAVFNSETGIIEGILVRGENDYVYSDSGSCQVPQTCAMNECRGEDVTRITNIQELINRH